VITGEANITTSARVFVGIIAVATADHLADEHMVDPPRLVAGDLVAGVGFTIHGFSDDFHTHHGLYTVEWAWN
jgi:hypothetical protein